MKTFSLRLPLLVWLCFLLYAIQAAVAQVPGVGSGTGVNVAFLQLFGTNTAFTAKVDTQSSDPYHQDVVSVPMEMSARDNKVRLDIDLAKVQSKDFSPSTLASLKQSGLDRMVSLFRPDKKASYTVYPGIQSYQEVALAKGENDAFDKGLKLERTPQGKETVEGHPCIKNKVVVRNGTNSVLNAVTWNATDLEDFPIKIEMKTKVNTIRMVFSQVRFVKPDAKEFEVPANYGRMK